MRIEPPAKKRPWGIIFAILLILGFSVATLLLKETDSQSYEVVNVLGNPEIKSAGGEWAPLEKGKTIISGDEIRAGKGSELDLKAAGQFAIRVKENSEISAEVSKHSLLSRRREFSFHMLRGEILGITEKKFDRNKILKISTPVCVAAVRGTIFRLTHLPDTEKTWVGVLRGDVRVSKPGVVLNPGIKLTHSESVEVGRDKMSAQKTKISQEEWGKIKEAYELMAKSATFEAEQKDLAREAGGFFKYVFDHGTFYMPKFGYAAREFLKDPSDRTVTLNVEYDVFPAGSYVGVYFKTRDLDISKFEKLEFYVRRVPGEDFPESFRIELKSKGQVVRAFRPKVFKKDWRLVDFSFSASKPVDVTEVTFLFANNQAGEFKKGALEFRDFQLVPKNSEK